MNLTETEKEIIDIAMNMLLANAGMEFNTVRLIKELADIIDPERELSTDRRLKELRDSVESIKWKVR